MFSSTGLPRVPRISKPTNLHYGGRGVMALALVTGAYDLRHRTRFMPNHNERSVQREICEEIWGEKQNAHSGILYADRKSTRLNSSHVKISYAVFCLKKKKKK